MGLGGNQHKNHRRGAPPNTDKDEDDSFVQTWFTFFSHREHREYYYDPVSGRTIWTAPTEGVISRLPGSPAEESPPPRRRTAEEEEQHRLQATGRSTMFERSIIPIITKPPIAVAMFLLNLILLSIWLRNLVGLAVLGGGNAAIPSYTPGAPATLPTEIVNTNTAGPSKDSAAWEPAVLGEMLGVDVEEEATMQHSRATAIRIETVGAVDDGDSGELQRSTERRDRELKKENDSNDGASPPRTNEVTPTGVSLDAAPPSGDKLEGQNLAVAFEAETEEAAESSVESEEAKTVDTIMTSEVPVLGTLEDNVNGNREAKAIDSAPKRYPQQKEMDLSSERDNEASPFGTTDATGSVSDEEELPTGESVDAASGRTLEDTESPAATMRVETGEKEERAGSRETKTEDAAPHFDEDLSIIEGRMSMLDVGTDSIDDDKEDEEEPLGEETERTPLEEKTHDGGDPSTSELSEPTGAASGGTLYDDGVAAAAAAAAGGKTDTIIKEESGNSSGSVDELEFLVEGTKMALDKSFTVLELVIQQALSAGCELELNPGETTNGPQLRPLVLNEEAPRGARLQCISPWNCWRGTSDGSVS